LSRGFGRRRFLQGSGALLGAAAGALPRLRAEERDVLVVVGGDFGWPDVTPHVKTPAFGRLMQEGRVLRRAYSFPVGGLTVYSELFGRYPARDGITQNPAYWTDPVEPPPDPAHPTLSSLLKARGYHTALFGKWNLGRAAAGPRARSPELFGFDTWRAGVPGLVTMGGGTGYSDWIRVDDGVEERTQAYQTTAVRDAFVEWWRATPSPRFALVGFHTAHQPFHRPPPALHDEDFDRPTRRDPELSGNALARFERREPVRRLFRAMVQSLDTVVGQMLRAVGRDAYVFLHADNGTPVKAATFDRPEERLKHTTFEGGVNVPFLVRGPGIEPGPSSSLVSTVDLPATVAELLGFPLSDGAAIDSVSFAPVLRAPAARTRTFVYSATKGEDMLRTETHKLRRLGGPEGEHLLYDLVADPVEDRSLNTERRGHAARLAKLRALLEGVLTPPRASGTVGR
jgi:arylsulfatase A-like enzyme